MIEISKSSLLARQVLDYLCPYLVTSGDYALNIQRRIAKRPAKAGMDNAFSAALTDADLSIQSFVEVVLLARFPDLAFFGEEYAHSLNMKYFPQNAPLTVYLDPVDGTLFFQDGLDNFNVIATLADEQQILAAACYIPGHKKLFTAVRGAGTVVHDTQEGLKGGAGTLLDISKNPPVVLTYDQEEAVARLTKDFEVCCIAREYRSGQPCLGPNSILLQQSSVILGGQKSQLIDWGAIAFLVQEAGGIASTWRGNPFPPLNELPDMCFPSLLTCRDSIMHRRVVAMLEGCEAV